MENSSEISLQDSKFTKVLWRLIVTIGIIFTATNIYREGNSYIHSMMLFMQIMLQTSQNSEFYIRCGTKYFEYPIVTDVYLGDASNVSESFPTITICLNSMHSRQKIEKFHGDDDKLVSALR